MSLHQCPLFNCPSTFCLTCVQEWQQSRLQSFVTASESDVEEEKQVKEALRASYSHLCWLHHVYSMSADLPGMLLETDFLGLCTDCNIIGGDGEPISEEFISSVIHECKGLDRATERDGSDRVALRISHLLEVIYHIAIQKARLAAGRGQLDNVELKGKQASAVRDLLEMHVLPCYDRRQKSMKVLANAVRSSMREAEVRKVVLRHIQKLFKVYRHYSTKHRHKPPAFRILMDHSCLEMDQFWRFTAEQFHNNGELEQPEILTAIFETSRGVGKFGDPIGWASFLELVVRLSVLSSETDEGFTDAIERFCDTLYVPSVKKGR